MWKDPIVEEIHQIREQIWEEANGDVEALKKRLRQKEQEHPERIVRKEDVPKAG